jgi:predicted ABC-type exoprotein transport system permease subunit
MDKRSKFAGFLRFLRLLGGFSFLFRAWVLAVIMIVCVPPLCDWHAYCLAFFMPFLLISLALSIWRATLAGTKLAYHTEEDQNIREYE